MSNREQITLFFINSIDDIDMILKSEFYNNKGCLKEAKEKLQNWYINFKETGTLKNISVEELKFMAEEITNIFDQYITTEPLKENYVERLSYDFSHLERYWKDEMLGGKKDGRQI